MHFDFLLGEFDGHRNRSPQSGDIDPTRVLNHDTPDLVLLDRRYSTSANTMQQSSDWVLLFRDRIAEVWGRRQRFDDPQSEHYVAAALRIQDPRPRHGFVEWPAMPQYDQPNKTPLALAKASSIND